ncbi:MAG: hypothetical protein NZ735_09505 [Candidatus Marinimicrobia bacterium]|nr:hypothetical protein [Candidatus Neomarinimicrobiota bacterium]
MTYKDGSYYKGQWKDGKRDGHGKYYKNGEFYEGNWKNDKFDGYGVLSIGGNVVYQGLWVNGKLRCNAGDVIIEGPKALEEEVQDQENINPMQENQQNLTPEQIRDRLNEIDNSINQQQLNQPAQRNQIIAELESYRGYNFYIQVIQQESYDDLPRDSIDLEVLRGRIDGLIYLLGYGN